MTAKTQDTTPPEDTVEPEVERPMPTNVIQALARIMEELPAIGKTKKPRADGEQGVTYAYRGIEEITAEAQALFAKYGVVVIPWTTVPIETREFQVKSGARWMDEKIEVHWRIYGPGGVDDFIEAQTLGIGRDNSDKAFNKGATQALKYLLLPMLLVADPKDDADGKTQENDGDSSKTTTRKPPARRTRVPDGAPTVDAEQEQSAENPASRTSGEDDIATMPAKDLYDALEAAGLPVDGNPAVWRLRLQGHRSGVAPATVAIRANEEGLRMATEKQRGLVNSFWKGLSREDRLDGITDIIGRPIESSSELTFDEAKAVIEAMKPED